jgi:hypothetical protein
MNDSFSIDLISDLHLTETGEFDWSGKATSLFCVVAGNVSDDLEVLRRTLDHLSNNYHGVFFIDGSLEHTELQNYEIRVLEIKEICDSLNNVVYLHNHVVILNNIAFIGSNGWYGNRHVYKEVEDEDYVLAYRTADLAYLSNSIKRLQHNMEVKRIVLVTNSLPNKQMAFNSLDIELPRELYPSLSLLFDETHKVRKWLFGTNDITVDVDVDRIQYVNNPVQPNMLYWPKRIEV